MYGLVMQHVFGSLWPVVKDWAELPGNTVESVAVSDGRVLTAQQMLEAFIDDLIKKERVVSRIDGAFPATPVFPNDPITRFPNDPINQFQEFPVPMQRFITLDRANITHIENPRVFIRFLRVQHDCPVSPPDPADWDDLDCNTPLFAWYYNNHVVRNGEREHAIADRYSHDTGRAFGLQQQIVDPVKEQLRLGLQDCMTGSIRKPGLRFTLENFGVNAPKRATIADMRALLAPIVNGEIADARRDDPHAYCFDRYTTHQIVTLPDGAKELIATTYRCHYDQGQAVWVDGDGNLFAAPEHAGVWPRVW
jgi:hypothetical protein